MILSMFLTYLGISLGAVVLGFVFRKKSEQWKFLSLAGSVLLILLSIFTFSQGIETQTGVDVTETANGYETQTVYEVEKSLSTATGSILVVVGFYAMLKSATDLAADEDRQREFNSNFFKGEVPNRRN